MNNLRLLYFAMPLTTVLWAFVLDMVADAGAIPELSVSVLYLFRMFVVLLSLASMVLPFTMLKDKLMAQLTLLDASAFLVILDYYLNISSPGSDNLLWFLPMIIVIYAVRYKAVSNTQGKPAEKR
ncbi:MAG: hypothetical protein U0I09_07495 [Bacteroidaceae bacterium]|nr:hypothetical protein [Bacteroidaceae bacterium]